MEDDDVLEKMRRYCNLSAEAREALLLENEALYNAFETLELPEAEKRKKTAVAGFYDVYQRAKLSAEQPVLRQPMLLSYGDVGEQHDRIHELAAAHNHDASKSLISFVRVLEQFKLWRDAARSAISVNQPGLSIKEIDKILSGGFRGHYSFHYLRAASVMLDLVAKYPRLLYTAITHTELIKFANAFRRHCGLEVEFWGRLTKEDRAFNLLLETANKLCRYQETGEEVSFAEDQVGLVSCLIVMGGLRDLVVQNPILQSFDMQRFERECERLIVLRPFCEVDEDAELTDEEVQIECERIDTEAQMRAQTQIMRRSKWSFGQRMGLLGKMK
jgi:hypothetical protein